MKAISKDKKNKPAVAELPALCRAVKTVRQALGWSQEKLAQQTSIHTQTISKFELGKLVPRDDIVLLRLHKVALDAKCQAEEELFRAASAKAMRELSITLGAAEAAIDYLRRYQDYPGVRARLYKVLKELKAGLDLVARQFVLVEKQDAPMYYSELANITRLGEGLLIQLGRVEEDLKIKRPE